MSAAERTRLVIATDSEHRGKQLLPHINVTPALRVKREPSINVGKIPLVHSDVVHVLCLVGMAVNADHPTALANSNHLAKCQQRITCMIQRIDGKDQVEGVVLECML